MPMPRGVSAQGGVQAQARGGVQAQAQGVSRPRPGGCPGPGGGLSKHALRQTPPQQMATAADGTHSTGIHSCLIIFFIKFGLRQSLIENINRYF